MKKIVCLLLILFLVVLSGCNNNSSVEDSSNSSESSSEIVANGSDSTNSDEESENTTENNQSETTEQTTSSSQIKETDDNKEDKKEDKKEESDESNETPKENNNNNQSSSSTPTNTETPSGNSGNSTKPETPKVSAWNGVTAKWTKGTGTASNPYLIESAEMLAYLAQTTIADNSYAEKHFLVTVDIDLKNRQWTPIGTKLTPFSGVFDAGGHTISNLNLSKTHKSTVNDIVYECSGLFGYTLDAKISNLKLDGVSWNFLLRSGGSDRYYIGSIVGRASADYEFALENCSVKNVSFSIDSDEYQVIYCGGLVGYASSQENASIELSKLSADVKMKVYTDSETYLGGTVGYFEQKGNTKISNLRAHLNLHKSTSKGQYVASSLIGGFNSKKGTIDLNSCYFTLETNSHEINITSSSGYSSKINGFCGKHYGVFKGKAKLTNVFFTYKGGADKKEYLSNYNLIYLLSDDDCTKIVNSDKVETLPKTCGFDTDIWDLSNLSSPKLK